MSQIHTGCLTQCQHKGGDLLYIRDDWKKLVVHRTGIPNIQTLLIWWNQQSVLQANNHMRRTEWKNICKTITCEEQNEIIYVYSIKQKP